MVGSSLVWGRRTSLLVLGIGKDDTSHMLTFIGRHLQSSCTSRTRNMYDVVSAQSPSPFGLVGLVDSYTVSAASPQLCPDARRGRQPTRCRCDSAPPHFTLERAICPQRPSGFWLLSTTMYIPSLEVTCLSVFVFPKVCSCIYAVLKTLCVQRCLRLVEARLPHALRL
jgi:hypothetical protein